MWPPTKEVTMSRHTLVEVAFALLRVPCSRHRPELLPNLWQPRFSVRKLPGHFLQMSQVVWRLLSHLAEKRLDLAEHGQEFSIGSVEHLLIDGLEHDQRGRHVPIADDHATPGALLPHEGLGDLLVGRRVELPDEPGTGLSQDGLPPQVEQLQDQVRTLGWCRHGLGWLSLLSGAQCIRACNEHLVSGVPGASS